MGTTISKAQYEVWDMKEASWKAFIQSGHQNYVEYINESVKEVKEKYNLKYWSELEKEKVN